MPKIKLKKRVRLEELLDKLSDSEIELKHYLGFYGTRVYPSDEDSADSKIVDFVPGDTFEIEVEQEIDVYTELDGLVGLYKYHKEPIVTVRHDQEMTINEILKFSNGTSIKPLAFYLLRDSFEMQLIWKEGEFVE